MDKNTVKDTHYSLNCNGHLVDLTSPKVMGILNLTPDSFYDESRFTSTQKAIKQAVNMIEAGATFIDIGGMSSRPGAELISSKQELERILPTVRAIKKEIPSALISIDTIYANTANICLDAGVDMINDISAGKHDENMLATVAKYRVPYVAMHMKGTPQTMKQLTDYDDLLLEMVDYFIERSLACQKAGIIDIILDPGFGFAKTIEQNFELLKRFHEFSFLDFPQLVGVSRKSMIWKALSISANEALNGTTALNMIALQNGANILRVHDVKEAVECVKLFKKLKIEN